MQDSSKLLNRKGLNDPNIQMAYHTTIEERWKTFLNQHSPSSYSIEEKWTFFKNTVNSMSKEILGFSDHGKHPEWIIPETLKLAEERRKLKSKRKMHPDFAKHIITYAGLLSEVRNKTKKI